jgi:hypothetical protein
MSIERELNKTNQNVNYVLQLKTWKYTKFYLQKKVELTKL